MKTSIMSVVVAVVALVISGCATDLCTLDVRNGTGTGRYSPLQTVAIQANPPVTNKTFEIWSGDISGIGNATNGSTTIRMNQLNKTVTAMYRDIIPPPPTPPTPVYTPVAGDTRDRGAEIWNANYNGMVIRLSVNDGNNLTRCGYPCIDGWYPLDPSVAEGIVLATAPDGGIIASARDFVSSRTGLTYHFVGFYVHVTGGTTLTAVTSITIPKDQCFQDLRYMFVTIQPNLGWFRWF